MRTKKLRTITCPNCGREYLPAEIFVPNAFFGNPKIIMRDDLGKIEHFINSSLDDSESYICDSCNKKFNVTAKISFSTELAENFEEESNTTISHALLFYED